MQLKRITLCVALAFAPNVFAAESAQLPDVVVTAEKLLPSSNYSGLDKNSLLRLRNQHQRYGSIIGRSAGRQSLPCGRAYPACL